MKIQLEDLPDDCVLEVLERMSPSQLMNMRLNKRLDRLATEKLGVKTLAVMLKNPFKKHSYSRFDCDSHGDISSSRTLFLNPNSRGKSNKRSFLLEKKKLFLTILSRFPNVKSIAFDDFEISEEFLLKVFIFCSKIDCIKLFASLTPIKEELSQKWSRFKQQMLNVMRRRTNNVETITQVNIEKPFETRILELIAERCPNIEHVEVSIACSLTREFARALKKLPKDCWIGIHCDSLETNYESYVIDELEVRKLNWFALFSRANRLSNLICKRVKHCRGVVEFDRLKRLDFGNCGMFDSKRDFIRCLTAGRFPLLEEFCFSTRAGFTEDDYVNMFRRMPLVEKLIITFDYLKIEDFRIDDPRWLYYKLNEEAARELSTERSRLPLASIHLLPSLEVIALFAVSIIEDPFSFVSSFRPKLFVKKLETYANVILLEKLLVVMCTRKYEISKEEKTLLEAEMNRLKRLKQKEKVKIDLIWHNKPPLV